MRLSVASNWPVSGHVIGKARPCDHQVERATIQTRKVGWLDQKGQVWLSYEDWANAGGPNGSITPLLIPADCQ